MRTTAISAIVAVVVAGCGAVAPTVNAPIDGVLDCEEGQVSRGTDDFALGSSEVQVVESALANWLDDGGSLEDPAGEYWSVVQNGREVAVALPERNGDGSWVVADVSTCGDPETGAAPIDGELDCPNDALWSQSGSVAEGTVGEPTPEAAVISNIERFQSIHGGEIVAVDDNTWSLVVEQREQVTMSAHELEAGGWIVTTVRACANYALP